jgi:hypothetical protein
VGRGGVGEWEGLSDDDLELLGGEQFEDPGGVAGPAVVADVQVVQAQDLDPPRAGAVGSRGGEFTGRGSVSDEETAAGRDP